MQIFHDNDDNTRVKIDTSYRPENCHYISGDCLYDLKLEWFLILKEELVRKDVQFGPIIEGIDYLNKSLVYTIGIEDSTVEGISKTAIAYNKKVNDKILSAFYKVQFFLEVELEIIPKPSQQKPRLNC